MHPRIFRLLILSIGICISLSFGAAQPIVSHLDYQLIGLTNEKTISLTYGVPHLARLTTLAGRLSSKSLKENAQLRPEVMFKKAELSLERNNKTVEQMSWPNQIPLTRFCRKMRTGDRLVVKLLETEVQTKAGVSYPLAEVRIIDTVVL